MECGRLFEWELSGADRQWAVAAKRQKWIDGFAERAVEVRFSLTARGERRIELRGEGEMFSPIIADGKAHGEPCLVTGGVLWIEMQQPASSCLTGSGLNYALDRRSATSRRSNSRGSAE